MKKRFTEHRDTVKRLVDAESGEAPALKRNLSHLIDADGMALTRIWGPNTISDFQLKNMGLKRTGITFSGGEYYRIAD